MAKDPFERFALSAFTPFARRFTDEKAQDLRDTQELYARVRAMHLRSRFVGKSGDIEIGGAIWGECSHNVSEPLETYFIHTIHSLLQHERVIFEFPEIDLRTAHLSLKELVDLRHFLRAKEYFHTHEEKIVGLLVDGLGRVFSAIGSQLPAVFAPSPFTIPLIFLLPEPKGFIDQLYGELKQTHYMDHGLFVEVFRKMYLNLCEVSGVVDPYEPKKPLKMPSKSDAPLQDIVTQYLKGTPFEPFFLAPAPLQFRYEERFRHMHIVGGSGAGKTTLLQNLILNDLKSEDPPALVIVDSQSDLIRKLSRLLLFDPDGGPLADRFLLITPREIKHPPALNIFDVNRGRLDRYDEETKEQVVAGVIQTFDYLFSGLIGADLTAKQGVFFRFVARLMLALPDTLHRPATILDMLHLMDDPTPYLPAIATLPDIQRNFFERDFLSRKDKKSTFEQTKDQIRYRLNSILENPTLARLFTSQRTKVDLFTTLNNGGIVLVDTAKDFLKGASGNFGRIFISLVLQAILERAAIPEDERKPTFLIVDEAAAYFDSNIDDLLTEARKYKLGCVFAHQFLDQATPSLRASLAANTAVKMAAGVSTGDARALAPDMRTTADFILGQPSHTFACHIRNVTPSAVSIPVGRDLFENEPRLSKESHDLLRAINRRRVALDDEAKKLSFAPENEPRNLDLTVHRDRTSGASADPHEDKTEDKPKTSIDKASEPSTKSKPFSESNHDQNSDAASDEW